MKKLRPSEVCVQDHIARNWQSEDLALDVSESKFMYCTLNPMF